MWRGRQQRFRFVHIVASLITLLPHQVCIYIYIYIYIYIHAVYTNIIIPIFKNWFCALTVNLKRFVLLLNSNTMGCPRLQKQLQFQNSVVNILTTNFSTEMVLTFRVRCKMYICAWQESQNKLRLFPYAISTCYLSNE